MKHLQTVPTTPSASPEAIKPVVDQNRSLSINAKRFEQSVDTGCISPSRFSSVTDLLYPGISLSDSDSESDASRSATGDLTSQRTDDTELVGANPPGSQLAHTTPTLPTHHGYAIESPAGLEIIRRAIGGFDGYLSYYCGVKPFSCDDRCLLRFAVMSSPGRFVLSDGAEVKAGEPVIDLHLWNEHIPPVPKHGPDLAWARLVGRWMKHSLVLLAGAVETNPAMLGVRAIRAKTNFVGWGGHNESLSRLIGRFGFEDVDEGTASMPERIHDALENLLIGALTWTHNPEALRRDKLIRQRRPVWMSIDTLHRRHADR